MGQEERTGRIVWDLAMAAHGEFGTGARILLTITSLVCGYCLRAFDGEILHGTEAQVDLVALACSGLLLGLKIIVTIFRDTSHAFTTDI